MKFLSALLVLAKAQEITTTATTTTEQWDHVASNEDMSKLNGSYRTSDKYGRRLEIEYLHGSVFQVKWKTYSGIVIKGTKHNFDVDWPHFAYKGYMVSIQLLATSAKFFIQGTSKGTLHENGDVTIEGIDFYAGQWLREQKTVHEL